MIPPPNKSHSPTNLHVTSYNITVFQLQSSSHPELNQHLPIMSLMTINVPQKPIWAKLGFICIAIEANCSCDMVTESSPSLQNPTNTSMHYNNTIEFEIQHCVHQLCAYNSLQLEIPNLALQC
jgi:hypothetical protein